MLANKQLSAICYLYPVFCQTRPQIASRGKLPGWAVFFCGKWRGAVKTATDSGNCGIFQKIPPARMTGQGEGGCGAGMIKEAGSGVELCILVYCALSTCNGAELLATVFCALATYMAEREGFEPSVPCGTTVFETVPFDHSGISPRFGNSTTIGQKCGQKKSGRGPPKWYTSN